MSDNFGFSASEAELASEGELTSYLGAINGALAAEMRRDPDVLIIGEDVGGSFGGAFKVTKGLADEFGDRRVMNMPMTELGFIGAANGMALMGLRPVVEVQFADFISTGFDSIVQFAATTHYRWGGSVPWVIRAPSDGGLRSGPFHSQNPEAWFVHSPGLKVVAPSTVADAWGLLISSIRDNNPVIYFESKPLYRRLKEPIPAEPAPVPLGSARIARSGTDLTVVSYGAMVHEAVAAADAAEGISAEVVDLRSLKPIDFESIATSVTKTGRLLIVHAATRLAGIGAEVAAFAAEELFETLDAPVIRLGGPDVPVPFSPPLEDAYRPASPDIGAAIKRLADY